MDYTWESLALVIGAVTVILLILLIRRQIANILRGFDEQ